MQAPPLRKALTLIFLSLSRLLPYRCPLPWGGEPFGKPFGQLRVVSLSNRLRVVSLSNGVRVRVTNPFL